MFWLCTIASCINSRPAHAEYSRHRRKLGEGRGDRKLDSLEREHSYHCNHRDHELDKLQSYRDGLTAAMSSH
jgi:hypothetical protein